MPAFAKHHGDAAAHGAEADHARAADGPQRLARGEAGHLARLALGEEHVAQRARFRARDHRPELRVLRAEGLREGQRHRRPDGFERGQGRLAAARLQGEIGTPAREERLVHLRGRPLARAAGCGVATRARPAPPRSPASAASGTTSSTSPRRSASSAGTRRPLRMMSSAASRPTRRGSRTVPPAPGNEAERHFGQAQLRVRRSHTVVAGQRQLAGSRPRPGRGWRRRRACPGPRSARGARPAPARPPRAGR